MSAKLLYNLSDENPDLHKQIGCASGIFNLFDRHHFLFGRRFIGNSHKRLPPGQTNNHEGEPSTSSKKKMEKNINKAANEKKRLSTESSRMSISSFSSCSSSYSSADFNKTSQLEPPSLSHNVFPETPAREIPTIQSNVTAQQSQKSLGMRDFVKDSIYREARGLVIKTAAREEAGHQTLKYIDSPRPSPQPKSAKTRISIPNESSFNRPAGVSNKANNARPQVAPKDTPRLSYDERELRNGGKSTVKLKELPRLSLDSRELSARKARVDMKSNHLLENLQRETRSSNLLNPQQEPGTQRRSNIVAKLMGLEILPDSMTTNPSQTQQTESSADVNSESYCNLQPSRSTRTQEDNHKNQINNSPRHSNREAASPRKINADLIKKPIAAPKFPPEPAPLKQLDRSRDQTSAPKTQTNSTVSVYGEIEKRLAQLEFKKSGKDLRALKQILEAMQKTKQMLEGRKDSASSFVSSTSDTSSFSQSSYDAISTTTTGTSMKSYKSSIVIMRSAKLQEKSSASPSAVIPDNKLSGLHRIQTANIRESSRDMCGKHKAKDLTPRPNRNKGPPRRAVQDEKNSTLTSFRSTQTSTEIPSRTGEIVKSSKSPKNANLRLQQKKLGLGNQSHSPTQSLDSSKTRMHPSIQEAESGSLQRKPRSKSRNLRQTDNQSSNINSDARDISHHDDASSLQSDSSISLASNADTEVTSKYRSTRMTDTDDRINWKQKNLDSRFKVNMIKDEPPKVALEQPSPVSILDATFYRDESPSPVKRIRNAFKDEEPLSSEEADWTNEDLNYLSSFRKPSLLSENDHKKVETVQSLVENISTSTEDFVITCDSENQDHKYISDILLASKLLRDLDSCVMAIQLGQSGLPINPKLFFALEQSKPSNEKLKDRPECNKVGNAEPVEKARRKLIFDAVNETLAHKLYLESCSQQCLPPSLLKTKRSRGQQLLQNLCSEIDGLQVNHSSGGMYDEYESMKSMEDLMHQSTEWENFQGQTPGIVLDVERLIFKDLINEVVCGEVAGLQGRHSGYCRQLFSK